MDRNFFVAIALAFLVLMVYQGFFVAPKRAEMLKNSQTIVNKVDVTKSNVNNVEATSGYSEPTKSSINEEFTHLKTTYMDLKFSNVGSSLHNVELSNDKKSLPLEGMLTIKGFEQAPFVLINT